ncbi:polyhydroxybutyrate depolymerase [Corynebacterium yudongzhengii]|uniref:Polyhydroxybutyrate depolymerase n=1 Tax=Corynebacterium yudongzhengii TaxID=2080740 RepID=A0A2U1T3X9_9CORY|nr:alpha/beta hydrolase-fold protein [Corynebacterium yudongzhengii]AWB80991.1 polyhydroxybutyrate depolymerase [Corynebacterium yudongzhengii]PWC00704.1 polyhydroxybutyrate depolymerase [Corynebacterium yudongzhengii]
MKKSLKTALVGSVVAGAVLAAPMASAQSLSSSSWMPKIPSVEQVLDQINFEPYVPPSSSVPSLPGTTVVNTEQVWLGDRSYRISLPDNYSADREYPVVLGFAGWKEPTTQFGDISRLHEAFGSEAIVVYVDAVDGAWAGAPYAVTDSAADVGFVREVVADVAAKHGREAAQMEVYAVGFSNGGGFSSHLACVAPDLVDSVVSVGAAHYLPTLDNCAAGAVPVTLIHGTNDGVINYQGGNRHGADYYSADNALGVLGAKNNCDMSNVGEHREGNVVIRTPADCDVPTSLHRVEGGEHTWYMTPGTTNVVVDAVLN